MKHFQSVLNHNNGTTLITEVNDLSMSSDNGLVPLRLFHYNGCVLNGVSDTT